MERIKRGPLEGVWNIVRFNWPFYAGACGALVAGYMALRWLPPSLHLASIIALSAGALAMVLSLAVSWYVYDGSGFYRFSWLQLPMQSASDSITNIHAGFDESSALLAAKFPHTMLTVLDFYDPLHHTEPSIRRARQGSAPYPGTQSASATSLPLPPASQDLICNILAAHEVRDATERVAFLREQVNALKPGGCIVVAEHLRDLPNLLAYNLGAFHFHTRRTWLDAFRGAGLRIAREAKHTPFITIFFLCP